MFNPQEDLGLSSQLPQSQVLEDFQINSKVMDSDSTSIKIEKLENSNCHPWKIRIQHILSLKDLEDYIVEDPPVTDQSSWTKKYKKAQAIIGLTLFDEI